MIEFLDQAGAETSKLEIRMKGKKKRGVYAARDLLKNEEILFIPEFFFITFEGIAGKLPFVGDDKLLKEWATEPLEHLSMFAYFLLERRKIPSAREYEAYIDLLPWDSKEHPITFKDHELSQLQASQLKNTLQRRKEFYKK